MLVRRLAFLAALAVVAVAAFFAVTALTDGGDSAPPRGGRDAPGGAGTPGPEATPAPGEVSAAARARAARLSAAEQVAQVFMVGTEGSGADASVAADLGERPWGAVLVGPENAGSPAAVAPTAQALDAAARAADVSPPLVVAGEIDGLPDQPGLRRPPAARRAARAAGAALAAAGADAVLAPQADLAVPAGPADDTGFSDDPARVAPLARAAVAGWLEGGVLPIVGHFPGQGAATQAPVEGPSTVGAPPEVDAFRPALRRAPAVIVSNAAYVAFDAVTPAALLPAVVRDLLRDDIGFDGAVIADDLAGAAAGTGGTIGAAAVEALRAGVDMVQVRDPGERRAAYDEVLAAVRGGELPAERLTEAVARVLELKARAARL